MKRIMFIFMMLLLFGGLFAQFSQPSAQHENQMALPKHGALLDGKTLVKANLLGMPLRNFSFYGERILTKRMSLVLGYNTMLEGQIPFIKSFTDDRELIDMQVSSTSFTPEIRFYLSKSGYSKGFYIAPYYRFEKFNVGELAVDVDYDIDEYPGTEPFDDTLTTKGGLNTHSFGVLLGVQWMMGKKKNIILDWTILGVHYGTNKISAEGRFDKTSLDLIKDAVDQIRTDLQEELGDMATINRLEADGNSVFFDMKTPWAMVKMSISIGFRF